MNVPESTPVEIRPLPPETERPVMVASLVEEAGNKFPARGRTLPDSGGITCMEAHELQPWENVT
jgi:hypothetical protein